MTADDEMEALARKEPTQTQMANIASMVRRALELRDYIAQGEEAIKEANRELTAIVKTQLPDEIAAAGLGEKFKLKDGTEITTKTDLAGSLPIEDLDRRAAGLAWLKANDGAAIINNEVVVTLGRNSDNLLPQVKEALDKLEVPYEVREGVHHMTLKKFAREKIDDGEPVDLENLGLYIDRQSKIKLPKSKR